ncbi:MAG: hypothetical protein FWG36_09700 [Oscillospiraceae bacterium]|nr:hypothetical protein [Oscillospiraceae bacterium]
MAVNLYIVDDLKGVPGLHPDKALARMNGDLDVYSTLLDKFLNQTPRTIPRLKTLLRDGKIKEYAEEMKALRIDLADIFALDLLNRANLLYDTAVNGELQKCNMQLNPFIEALQSFAYEVKQCRTQESIDNSDEAALKAAEMDIGSAVVNNKYSTVNKSKFLELYKRLNDRLYDKALNLANVLKSMGYDAELTGALGNIVSDLGHSKTTSAVKECRRLLILLGCPVPDDEPRKLKLLLVDVSPLTSQVKRIPDADYELITSMTAADAVTKLKSSSPPDFILINSNLPGTDAYLAAEQIKNAGADIPFGFVFDAPTSQDILKAKQTGAVEFFILPLDERIFLEKLAKYKQQ